jgi:heme A synthase
MLLVILNLWYRKQLNFGPSLSIICFALTSLLAMVGMVTPDIIHPVVTFINLTAGMLTTAVLWLLVLKINRLRVTNNPEPLVTRTAATWLSSINVCLVIVVIASGAWVSANFASGACHSMTGCEFIEGSKLMDAFDLSREIEISDGSLVLGSTQVIISSAHHLIPTLLFVLLLIGGYLNFQSAPISSVLATILAVGLIFMGLIDAGLVGNNRPSLLSAWMHNFYSMLLLLAVIYNREAIK